MSDERKAWAFFGRSSVVGWGATIEEAYQAANEIYALDYHFEGDYESEEADAAAARAFFFDLANHQRVPRFDDLMWPIHPVEWVLAGISYQCTSCDPQDEPYFDANYFDEHGNPYCEDCGNELEIRCTPEGYIKLRDMMTL